MRYKAIVAYEGSLFSGWQIQVNPNTVQGHLEETLSKMEKKRVHITAAGRTDRGVNALGQVFHFDSDLKIPLEKMALAINNQLIDGIHIRHIEVVDDRFHARFDAKWKYYRYSIECGPFNLFDRNHVLQLNKSLDIEAMIEASKVFVGTHDFTSFNSNTLVETPNQVRTIYAINLALEGTTLHLDYYGEGFMRYMVRMLTQTLIEVGMHRLTTQDVIRLLEAKDKDATPYNARPQGLTLVHVEYDKPFEGN